MAKVIDLLGMATLCNILQKRDMPLSGYLAGMEMALMSKALETMLRGDISQELAAEIGDGIEQCV